MRKKSQRPKRAPARRRADKRWVEMAERLKAMDPEAAKRLIRAARQRLTLDAKKKATKKPN